jgi:hypothetical protein
MEIFTLLSECSLLCKARAGHTFSKVLFLLGRSPVIISTNVISVGAFYYEYKGRVMLGNLTRFITVYYLCVT